MSWTKENRDLSSLKVLHVELRPSLKSFIYIENKRRPITDPCGTPDFTSQEDL